MQQRATRLEGETLKPSPPQGACRDGFLKWTQSWERARRACTVDDIEKTGMVWSRPKGSGTLMRDREEALRHMSKSMFAAHPAKRARAWRTGAAHRQHDTQVDGLRGAAHMRANCAARSSEGANWVTGTETRRRLLWGNSGGAVRAWTVVGAGFALRHVSCDGVWAVCRWRLTGEFGFRKARAKTLLPPTPFSSH